MDSFNQRAYLAISLSHRKNMDQEIEIMKACLLSQRIELFIFVDHYNFQLNQEKEMMVKAFEEIERSDFLIAEVSKKAIGVGVEVGYARAKGIPVVYVRKDDSEHSTTVAGCSSNQIIYTNGQDLNKQLPALF